MLTHTGPCACAFTTGIPIYESKAKVIPEGSVDPWTMLKVSADEDFIDALGIELVAGRNFSRHIPSDSSKAVLLNETAVRRLGWQIGGVDPEKDALGKTFTLLDGGRRVHVVGVVKDYHIGTLREPIKPAFLKIRKNRHLLVRIRPERVPETMAFLKET